jgi:hypothetical protein
MTVYISIATGIMLVAIVMAACLTTNDDLQKRNNYIIVALTIKKKFSVEMDRQLAFGNRINRRRPSIFITK